MRIFTKQSAAIGDFLEFLAACNPGVSDALRRTGADAASIAKLAAVSGFELPAFYVEFLKSFGKEAGYARIAADGFSTVQMLLEHYEDPVELAMTPAGGVVIATGGLAPSRMLLPTEGQEEAQVACFIDSDVEYFVARSFAHVLHQETWLHGRFVNRKRHVTSHSKDNGLVAQTTKAIAAMGLEPYWFSDRFGSYCESGDEWACVRADHSATTVWIGSEAPAARERLRDELRSQLGFLDERDFSRAGRDLTTISSRPGRGMLAITWPATGSRATSRPIADSITTAAQKTPRPASNTTLPVFLPSAICRRSAAGVGDQRCARSIFIPRN